MTSLPRAAGENSLPRIDAHRRSSSHGSFLDLREVNIAEEPAPAGDCEGPSLDGPTEASPRSTTPRDAPSISLPKQNELTHFAIDIGGSLIKLVYFSPDVDADAEPGSAAPAGGRLHFLKFETAHVDECVRYIEAKGLHRCSRRKGGLAVVKATGGGAFRFAELFKERLGLTLEKEDEMGCLVSGATFLLQELRDEAFTFLGGRRGYLSYLSDSDDLFPFLLVNIGSGVSILRVARDGHERISGTNMGGGTFWGLCRLLTGCKSFDDMLALSMRGNNANTDMLVGDIYGGVDYSRALGLSATTIASSFGKVVMDIDKELDEYRKEDLALSLLRAISYNIAHIAVLNAMRYGLKRIFFGGFFIRGHAYTMDTISFAINFWSKGELSALFLRHEGFLGALGSFLRYYDPADDPNSPQPPPLPTTMGAKKGSWIERMQRLGLDDDHSAASATDEDDSQPLPPARAQAEAAPGVLHLVPGLSPFPLLRESGSYVADTLDLVGDEAERSYWLAVLEEHVGVSVQKAVASDGGGEESRARGAGFEQSLRSLLARVRVDPHCYGRLSLSALLEVREELLRQHFGRDADAFRAEKAAENAAALTALPGLLDELDALSDDVRPAVLVEGVLAGNLFDWGAAACVALYEDGTIGEKYRQQRLALRGHRPLGADSRFDAFLGRLGGGKPYARALLFCDNAGADLVLGMLPFARLLLQRGTDVALVANSAPSLNDVTSAELGPLLEAAAACDPLLRAAIDAARAAGPPCDSTPPAGPGGPARLWVVASGSGSPCLDLRRCSRELCAACGGADLVVLEGMGRAVHTNLRAGFVVDTLKLATIKNERLAASLFGGKLYDAVAVFEPRPGAAAKN